MKIHRDWRPLVKELKLAGYVVLPGGNHYGIHRVSDGKKVNQLPSTPSDHRAVLNKRCDLRKAGILV